MLWICHLYAVVKTQYVHPDSGPVAHSQDFIKLGRLPNVVCKLTCIYINSYKIITLFYVTEIYWYVYSNCIIRVVEASFIKLCLFLRLIYCKLLISLYFYIGLSEATWLIKIFRIHYFFKSKTNDVIKFDFIFLNSEKRSILKYWRPFKDSKWKSYNSMTFPLGHTSVDPIVWSLNWMVFFFFIYALLLLLIIMREHFFGY